MTKKSLNPEELEVLDAVLRYLETDLPIYRQTDFDGPNEWGLIVWSIPSSIQALGAVEVLDSEAAEQLEHIRFRRPRISESEAELTLEMPHETRFFRLEWSGFEGWRVR